MNQNTVTAPGIQNLLHDNPLLYSDPLIVSVGNDYIVSYPVAVVKADKP